MSDDSPWDDLIVSARARRSRDAPFFKPACLVAVVDLITEGVIDPAAMDAERIVERVDRLVDPVHTGRPDMRWRPVWHLSNDGAWVFTKNGRRIGPEDFEPARKPDSLREWRSSFDHLAVPTGMLEHWRSPADRATLRRAAIAMLETGDAACQSLALDLIDAIARSPVAAQRPGGGQGFSADGVERRAVELHAMKLTRAWFEGEGWTIEDRSASESYDFLAERDGATLFVEVKGTTGDGSLIQLTRLEVEFALAHRAEMALAVVSGIRISHAGQNVDASSGVLVVRQPWAPALGSLRPISYTCQLEAGT
jgi:hypothetical protein